MNCDATPRGVVSQRTNRHQSKVALVTPLEDERGKYLVYCTFRQHEGVLTSGRNVCLERNCNYMRKAYLANREEISPLS